MTEAQTRTFNAPDGTNLFLRTWQPVGAPVGALLLCHGLGEHSGRYAHVADALVQAGVSVWAQDHRGHGQSPGARGALRSADDLVVDSEAILKALATETGLTPFVLGHSMGGPVAGMIALRGKVPIKGLVLSSPALLTNASGGLIAFGKALSGLLPNLPMSNQLDRNAVARDPDVIAAYASDPLVHGTITPRLFAWIIGSGEALRAAASTWKTPTLLMFAGMDKLVNPQGARAFGAALPAGVGEVTEYPAFFHEIFNDPEKAQPLAQLVRWLAARR